MDWAAGTPPPLPPTPTLGAAGGASKGPAVQPHAHTHSTHHSPTITHTDGSLGCCGGSRRAGMDWATDNPPFHPPQPHNYSLSLPILSRC